MIPATRPLTTILAAVDHADARAWLGRNPQPGRVIIATVRMLGSQGRGHTADRIVSTPALDRHPKHTEVMCALLPCVASRSNEVGDITLESVHTVRIVHAPRLAWISIDQYRATGVERDGNLITIDGLNRRVIYRIISAPMRTDMLLVELVSDEPA